MCGLPSAMQTRGTTLRRPKPVAGMASAIICMVIVRPFLGDVVETSYERENTARCGTRRGAHSDMSA